MGPAVFALLAYIGLIIVWVAVLKRTVGEALAIAFLVLCLFAGSDFWDLLIGSLAEAFNQPIVYSAMTFVFLGAIFLKTGLIDKQVEILNSVLGRLRGGAGYVSTIAAALFGAVSHGGSGNAAAIGAVTIPWMNRSNWPPHLSATVVAGNAGLGTVIPPSPSLLLLAGSAAVVPVIGLDQLILPGLVAALYMILYRLALVWLFVRRHKIQPVDASSLLSFATAWRRGWTSLLVFTGVAIPVLVTIGPLSGLLTQYVGKASMKAIDIVVWIPALMAVAAIVLGWKSLPHSPSGWYRLFLGAGPRYASVGSTVVFAFAASAAMTNLGLAEQLNALLSGFSAPPIIMTIAVGILIILVAGPLPSAATVATVGGVSFSLLLSAGIPPAVAATTILIFSSTEGASPPGAPPIYIASGIAEINPVKTFAPLIFLYVIPMFALGVIIAMRWLPIQF